MNKFLGISLAVLGIALAVVPMVADCASQGKFMTGAMGMQMAMRCSENRIPELALGIPMALVGAVMAFNVFKSKTAHYSIAIMAVVLAVAGMLVPTTIARTCDNPTMTCNTAMKPAIYGIGSLAVLGGLTGVVVAARRKKS